MSSATVPASTDGDKDAPIGPEAAVTHTKDGEAESTSKGDNRSNGSFKIPKKAPADGEVVPKKKKPMRRSDMKAKEEARSGTASAAATSTPIRQGGEPPRNKPPAAQATSMAASSARKRSRSRSRSRSPPRKRPGQASRVNAASLEAVRRRQEEREAAERKAVAAERGIDDVVRQHYNAVPERGREWRKTDSKIRGLRSYNNWVKSVVIQKFSPGYGALGLGADEQEDPNRDLLVLDMGCGKGGDLQKWNSAPRRVGLYVGCDPADVSIENARKRYQEGPGGGRDGGRGRRQHYRFEGHFFIKDCFGEWLGDIPIIRQVGIDDNVGPGGNPMAARFGGGGFDVVTMMFCMHYAFESEAKARGMLKNVAGALKKGGRFIGVIPNSDVLSDKVEQHHKRNSSSQGNGQPPADDDDDDWDPEKPSAPEKPAKPAEDDLEANVEPLEWGNSIYRVKFPGKTPADGVFRPPFGWKYFYFLEEAVEEIPEYVVPWEAFRALAEDYNLELQYRKTFTEIWEEEKDDPDLGPLSERMGVRGRGRGPLQLTEEERDAVGFYHAFCFHKV